MKHRPLSTQIAEYELDWRARAWPLDLEEVFGRRAPVVLEIGFGNGEFLVDLAAAAPEADHLGVEISWGSALRLYKRLDHARLSNVHALVGEAEAILATCFASGQLSAVYVNHPCPWPKERHSGRRLLQPAFLSLLADRMAPGAGLLIATDHAELADWVEDVLVQEPALASRHATPRIHDLPGRKPTKYQRKALEQGIHDHYFQWERRVASPRFPVPPPRPSPAPEIERTEMPSLTLAGRREDGALLEGFSPVAFHELRDDVDLVVKLEAAYLDAGGRTWLVEAMTREGPLRQDFALLVVEKQDRLLVKLGKLGSAHPTDGVKRAVWHLGAWIRGRHPGLELVHHNLGDAAQA